MMDSLYQKREHSASLLVEEVPLQPEKAEVEDTKPSPTFLQPKENELSPDIFAT